MNVNNSTKSACQEHINTGFMFVRGSKPALHLAGSPAPLAHLPTCVAFPHKTPRDWVTVCYSAQVLR